MLSKVCKHISIKAKHISSKELNSTGMANVINVNLENIVIWQVKFMENSDIACCTIMYFKLAYKCIKEVERG